MKTDDLYRKITKIDLEISPFNFERFEIKDISYSKDSSGSRTLINVNGILTVSGGFRGKVFFNPEEEKNIKANYDKHNISNAIKEYLEKHGNLKRYMKERIENYIKKTDEIRTIYLPERIMYPILKKPLETASDRLKEAFTFYAVNIEKETLFRIDKSDQRLMDGVNSVIEKVIKSIEKSPLRKNMPDERVDIKTQAALFSRIENYENFKEEIVHNSELLIINNTGNLVIKDIFTKYPNKYEQGYFTFIETDFSVGVNLSIESHTDPELEIDILFEEESSYIRYFLTYFKTIVIFNYEFSGKRVNQSVSYAVSKVMDPEDLDEKYVYVAFRIPLFV